MFGSTRTKDMGSILANQSSRAWQEERASNKDIIPAFARAVCLLCIPNLNCFPTCTSARSEMLTPLDKVKSI